MSFGHAAALLESGVRRLCSVAGCGQWFTVRRVDNDRVLCPKCARGVQVDSLIQQREEGQR